jgi:2-iminobutanoate/2-iminopropanoate deaminase
MSEITRIPTQYSFSSAVVAGDYIYLSHHRGYGDTFAVQLNDTFKRLSETLSNIGLSLDNLVKVNVWLKNIKDVPEMEKLFVHYFKNNEYPVRMSATTEFIDEDCLLMIDGIAYRKV